MIERAANGVPQLQIAVDGWWERAIRIRLPADGKVVDQLLHAAGTGDVAAEVVWEGSPIVFVGARSIGGGPLPLRAIAARADWTPFEAHRILGGNPRELPVKAELGAVNAWRSVGPMSIAIDAQREAIRSALANRADLQRCRYPVALEVGWMHPETWWAVEVSDRSRDTHVVDVDRVVAVLGMFREFCPTLGSTHDHA